MQKIMTFTNSGRHDNYSAVDGKINEFIKTNKNIEIISIARSSNQDRNNNDIEHYVTILYKEKTIML